jgi:hypothetical protein
MNGCRAISSTTNGKLRYQTKRQRTHKEEALLRCGALQRHGTHKEEVLPPCETWKRRKNHIAVGLRM